MIETIKKLSKEISKEIISIRRHIHTYPELSYEEYQTSNFVTTKLKEIGLSPIQGIAKTGIVCMIEGKNPTSKIIALRADMDALPIVEANDIGYKSKNKGVMHACGHDAHTASLLGTAYILQTIKHQFDGSIKLIFQPGEEKNPGGASLMIKENVLKNPTPSKIFGQHVMPLIPVGKFGFRSGMYMASADEIYLTIVGNGGHGAAPNLCVDTVLIASHIIIALQQIVSRNANPTKPTVLSFGKIEANGATNIIPNEVKIIGTFRAMDEEWRKKAHQLICNIAKNTAKGMGGNCEVNISKGYPYLENNSDATREGRTAAEMYIGKNNVIDLDLSMGAEDFSFYSHEIPACFYRLGTRNEKKGITSYVHTSTFNIDESALELGSGMMAWIAINNLSLNNN